MRNGGQTEGFWEFSVRTYRKPGVADVCLALQDDYGADVNMVLFGCWLGTHGIETDRELFEKAAKFSARWALGVVLPLRFARTWMKNTGCALDGVATEACMALREEIKSLELASEQLQQHVLESLVSDTQPRQGTAKQDPQAIEANLHQYAAFAGIDVRDDVQRKLSLIIDAVLQDQGRRSSA